MKKIFFLLTITAACISCKKENNGTPSSVVHPDLVKSVTSNSGTTTYQYDAQGRRTRTTHPNGARVDYEYLSGIVNEKFYNANGILTGAYVHELNGDGLAVKETNPADPAYSRIRTYNSDKQLLKWVSVSGNNTTTADYFYSNGNYDSARFMFNGTWSYTEKATYYPEKLNVLNTQRFGMTYIGSGTRNLHKTSYNIFPNGSSTEITTSNYEFDVNGRVIKANYDKNGSQDITFYTY